MGTLDHVGMQCADLAASAAFARAFVRDPDGNNVEACCQLPE